MEKNSKHIYQLKITLKDIHPPIWRRIQIPENYSFWDLHVAIQDVMGWEDYHLHEFQANLMDGEKISIKASEWGQRITEWLSTENEQVDYIYDFGDCWEHKIKLEKILPAEESVDYPICIKGKRNCPPEDCGGVGGYEELLEILKDPDDEEYEEMLEWVEEDFDSEHFDPKEVIFSDPTERRNELL
jgi:hypothetical protein